MKRGILNLMYFAILLSGLSAVAQDWKNVNPKMNRVLNDTTFARATEVTLLPGEKSDMHTHPAHFFYALTDGKLKVNYKDGKTLTYDLKQGFSGVSGPEGPHTAENAGTAPLKFLLVELKDRPYVEPKKKK